jgi:hypothetical protein
MVEAELLNDSGEQGIPTWISRRRRLVGYQPGTIHRASTPELRHELGDQRRASGLSPAARQRRIWAAVSLIVWSVRVAIVAVTRIPSTMSGPGSWRGTRTPTLVERLRE